MSAAEDEHLPGAPAGSSGAAALHNVTSATWRASSLPRPSAAAMTRAAADARSLRRQVACWNAVVSAPGTGFSRSESSSAHTADGPSWK